MRGRGRRVGLRLGAAGIVALCAVIVAGNRCARWWATGNLIGAVNRGSVVAARWALDRGADPNAMVSAEAHLSLMDCLRMLLPGSPVHGPSYRYPLLMVASGHATGRARAGVNPSQSPGVDVQLMRLLLEHGAHPDTPDSNGVTTLYLTSCRDNADCAEALLQFGADPNRRGLMGSTPLVGAAGSASVRILRALLDHRADPNARDDLGHTALQEAASAGDLEAARLLVSRGADVNAQDGRGSTALIEAVIRCDARVVKLLLDAGADQRIANAVGRTPMRMALDSSDHAIAALLRRAKTPGRPNSDKLTRRP